MSGDILHDQSNNRAETGFPLSYTGELTRDLATPEMLAGLGSLMHQLNQDYDGRPITLEQLEPYFESHQAILVDVQEGKLMGTISAAWYASQLEDDKGDIFSGSLVVDERYRAGNGRINGTGPTSYGRLLDQLVQLGMKYNAQSLNCTIDPDNEPSRLSHETRGYNNTANQFWEKKLTPTQSRFEVPRFGETAVVEEYPDDYTGPVWGMTEKLRAGMVELLGSAYDEERFQAMLQDPYVMVAIKLEQGRVVCALPVTIGGELYAGQYAFQGPKAMNQEWQERQSAQELIATQTSLQGYVDGFAAANGAYSIFHLVHKDDEAGQAELSQLGFGDTGAMYYSKPLEEQRAA